LFTANRAGGEISDSTTKTALFGKLAKKRRSRKSVDKRFKSEMMPDTCFIQKIEIIFQRSKLLLTSLTIK